MRKGLVFFPHLPSVIILSVPDELVHLDIPSVGKINYVPFCVHPHVSFLFWSVTTQSFDSFIVLSAKLDIWGHFLCNIQDTFFNLWGRHKIPPTNLLSNAA